MRETPPTRDSEPVILFYKATLSLMEIIRARFPTVHLRHAATVDDLQDMLPQADILVGSKFPSAAFRAASRLRWIQMTSAGVDSLMAARDLPSTCLVTNARGIHGQLMADYTLAMIGAVQWQLPLLLRRQGEHRWKQFATESLSGKRLTLVGTGTVGCAIAGRAAVSGLRVTGVARRDTSKKAGFERIVTGQHLHEALADADFVVLAIPATEETIGMMDAAAFATMKPGATLINIARGDVVVEAELIHSLERGHLKAAVLDVFATEPLPGDNRFWNMPNVIVTPHLSGYTSDYEEQVARILRENLTAFLSGKPLMNLVDLFAGY